MSPDHVSILIVIICVIFLISIVKYHEHYQGYQLLQNPFQAEGCENLKRRSHLDCKCIRNSKGEIHGQNQCTYNVNCIETVGKLPGLEESYALVNPPIQFSNWIKEKTTNENLDAKTIHTYISKPCLYKNNKLSHGKIGKSYIGDVKPIYEKIPNNQLKENIVQANYFSCKMSPANK